MWPSLDHINLLGMKSSKNKQIMLENVHILKLYMEFFISKKLL